MPLEEQVLPSPDLKPLHDKLVWVWVFRDFQKGTADLAAERVLNRYGVTSWPQMLFVDPATEKVLLEPARDVQSFQNAAQRAIPGVRKPAPGVGELQQRLDRAKQFIEKEEVEKAKPLLKALAAGKDPWEFALEARDLLEGLEGQPPIYTGRDLSDPDSYRRANALEQLLSENLEDYPTASFAKEALPLLKDPCGDVRLLAVRYVAKRAPGKLLESLPGLLEDPTDPVKWAAFDFLKQNPDPKAGPMLLETWKALDEKRILSRNPNVFRGHLAAALGEMGDASAIPLLEPIAWNPKSYGGTSSQALQSLGSIGRRCGAKLVTPSLLKAFPEAGGKDMMYRAKAVHRALSEATGRKDLPEPEIWDESARASLLEAWKAALQ